MRTNIDIDDRLMRPGNCKRSRARTKKAVVEAGLKLLVATHAQSSIPPPSWQGAMGGRFESIPPEPDSNIICCDPAKW